MPVQNSEVRDIFTKFADLLDIEGANEFRVRAYRNAARTVSGLSANISDMVKSGQDLTELPGIGKDLAGKIKEIVDTGTLSQLQETRKKTPQELNKLLKIEGLGPKRVKKLNRKLGITSLEQLKKAAQNGKIQELEGLGKKTEQSILQSIEQNQGQEERIKLLEAEQQAASLVAYLKKSKGIKELTIAGSYRRRKETVGDLDILVTCEKDSTVMQRFVEYEDVSKIISRGKSRSTIVLRSGLHVDLCLLAQVSYGAALHYFTGSKSHNIAIRKIGQEKGYKINEYGVFKGRKRIAGKTEKEVYGAVDLPYIEPELREDRGEIQAARNNQLPSLIELNSIQGDLHCHTRESDGHNSLEEMAKAAREKGYAYLAITEHSQKVAMAKGLNRERLAAQIDKIDQLNADLEDFTLLKGIEVDILEDGALDLPDDILKKLDIVVCSIHYNQNLSRKKQTRRIIRAMDNPCCNILGHPTGRLINKREPYEVDMEEIMRAASERGCHLELNAHPDRLDLSDRFCKMAKEMHVKLAVSTDAHGISDLDFMRFGIGQARRGWLEAQDVINTYSLEKLKKHLKR
jgi:DNA polymerase (family X)